MSVAQRQDKLVRQTADGSIARDPREHGEEKEASLPRRLFVEVFGTFALVTVAAGADTVAALTDGDVSGAHFNPAVTLAFAARRDSPWRLVPAYWAAEFGGALLAATLLRVLFGTVDHLGVTQPKHGVGVAFVMEIVLTLLLVTVILGTATRNRLIGPNAAIAVGGTIALCGLFALPVSGASMNPARSLGPALVGGTTAHWWIYVVGPLTGGLLAVLCTWIMHGGRKPAEEDAAGGDGADTR